MALRRIVNDSRYMASRLFSMAMPDQLAPLSNDKFRVKVAVKNYLPEEVRVKVNNGYLVIEGHHEETGPQGKTTREFTKWFKIPEDVDPATLEHDMTADGTLSLTANRKMNVIQEHQPYMTGHPVQTVSLEDPAVAQTPSQLAQHQMMDSSTQPNLQQAYAEQMYPYHQNLQYYVPPEHSAGQTAAK